MPLRRRATLHTNDPAIMRLGLAESLAIVAVALGSLVIGVTSGVATYALTVGSGGTSVNANGKSISTSDLTLGEFAKLQGVPPSRVSVELEQAAAETSSASAVDGLVSSLPANAPLATALNDVSSATGGALTPQQVLERVIAENGSPGTAGSNGAPGSSSAPTAGPTASDSSHASKPFSLHLASRRLKGRPGSRVRIRFDVSSAASLRYSGRKLASGTRALSAGTNVLMIRLPRKRGHYQLTLRALGTTGQFARATVALIDEPLKAARKPDH